MASEESAVTDPNAAMLSLTALERLVGTGEVDTVIVAFADIGNFLDTPYKHLSSGMKVRIAFAVITQLDEPILIVDEVLAVGDRMFREKCYKRIEEMLAEGRTMFFVSHNEKEIRRFCTRGLYLNDHELALDSDIGSVLARYNSDYGG